MKYRSILNNNELVSFSDALFQGLAKDGSLFVPNKIPSYSLKKNYVTYHDLAKDIIYPFVKENINHNELDKICEESFNFKVPLKKIDDNIYILELFHGPTLAFKDFAARFLARSFSILNQNKLTILVATSGDTGGAVANGFSGVEGINVVILYPSKRVTEIQELQLTRVQKNVKSIEVNGTFDDCQKLVKMAFSDKKLRNNINLTSANSINIGRLIPQITYYVWAKKKLENLGEPTFCVPSGNLGNLTGGILAKLSGVKIKGFLATTNSNDSLVRYLKNGNFKIESTIKTISNAMDVGDPSNLERIKFLYNFNLNNIKKDLKSTSVNDAKTIKMIKKIKKDYNYTVCPHTAVGLANIENKKWKNSPVIYLATAHPLKFKNIIEPIIEEKIKLPSSIKSLYKKKKKSISMNPSYENFKNFLLTNF